MPELRGSARQRTRAPGRGKDSSKEHGKGRAADRQSPTSYMTGKGRYDEGKDGSWLQGIPYLKSEWCRAGDDCRRY
eukprot:1703815-Heterocapsa_arctica.AAC.1